MRGAGLVHHNQHYNSQGAARQVSVEHPTHRHNQDVRPGSLGVFQAETTTRLEYETEDHHTKEPDNTNTSQQKESFRLTWLNEEA